MSTARDTADHIELAIDTFAFAAFIGMQRVSEDNRLRREINAHNRAVAAARAARARRRDDQLALGRRLQQRYLESRRAN